MKNIKRRTFCCLCLLSSLALGLQRNCCNVLASDNTSEVLSVDAGNDEVVGLDGGDNEKDNFGENGENILGDSLVGVSSASDRNDGSDVEAHGWDNFLNRHMRKIIIGSAVFGGVLVLGEVVYLVTKEGAIPVTDLEFEYDDLEDFNL